MQHRHIHRIIWIKELNGYGIQDGPNGEELQDMEYYAWIVVFISAYDHVRASS